MSLICSDVRESKKAESRESRPRPRINPETETKTRVESRDREIKGDITWCSSNPQKSLDLPHNPLNQLNPQYIFTDIYINLLKSPHIPQYPSKSNDIFLSLDVLNLILQNHQYLINPF